ncbi:M20/M25/M40 family metallo-hydrolase [Rhodohalobacter sp. SW132]|uniref:M20/M25/M40 family metallo-hydrolase n=1 Tax=Rhodohalobacter sp. SW132 TaxID=2293433 RepID=UPI000E2585B2|nr:M20/M25/M40 family metallo-hydrolase [Rhodohalobacter sp. SW132]REL33382.1 M20/M25/M40 family metallo-hydrolase [Rhodohalobacter sp. SW132]
MSSKYYKLIGFLFAILSCLVISATAQQNYEEFELDSQYTNEIESLVGKATIQQAFTFIEEFDEQTVQNQILINEIPAPPFMEDVRAEKYLEMMMAYGLTDVSIDEEGNVIGKRPGTTGEKTIVISAHLDTVFPEDTDVTVEVRNDTLYAPGITDDARGLTTVLTILKALQEVEIQTEADIWFVGTVGEEGLGDLRGVKHLFREGGPQIDSFISIDGSNDQRIVNKALGSHRYRVTFEGPGGHSWGAFGTANPAHALGRAIYHFEEAASEFVKEGPRTSYNVGRIGGGTSVNSVPFSNWMEVDMRSESQQQLQQIDQLLHEAVDKGIREANEIKTEGRNLTVDMDMIGDRPSGEISPDTPFIQKAIAASQYFGYEPELRRSSTDSNVPISLGIPSMTLGGGGSSSGAHSLDEWWYNDDGYIGIQRAFLILISQAGLSE